MLVLHALHLSPEYASFDLVAIEYFVAPVQLISRYSFDSCALAVIKE